MAPEELVMKARDHAQDFALSCRQVEERTPATAKTSLDHLVMALASELWDSGFSTVEIQAAFEFARLDIVRYAGSDLRNGTGIRGISL